MKVTVTAMMMTNRQKREKVNGGRMGVKEVKEGRKEASKEVKEGRKQARKSMKEERGSSQGRKAGETKQKDGYGQ